MARQSTKKQKSSNGANLGFEATLWAAADKLRGHMDAAEYKHVVLGLIFLKYISDAFEERHVSLETDLSDPKSEWYIAEPISQKIVANAIESRTLGQIRDALLPKLMSGEVRVEDMV
ncbi:MAG: type I restriction-modification system subunit M N-terminal domain-containing protein [Methanoregula sp.]|nr:type I restriction-modification system subunit M N-terminal domain-containing protein [Methanoregula sp.]